jgi:hypothetical protein
VMSEMPKAPPLAAHTVRTPRQSTCSRVPLTPHRTIAAGQSRGCGKQQDKPAGPNAYEGLSSSGVKRNK